MGNPENLFLSVGGAKFIQLINLKLKRFQDQINHDKPRPANHDIKLPK